MCVKNTSTISEVLCEIETRAQVRKLIFWQEKSGWLKVRIQFGSKRKHWYKNNTWLKEEWMEELGHPFPQRGRRDCKMQSSGSKRRGFEECGKGWGWQSWNAGGKEQEGEDRALSSQGPSSGCEHEILVAHTVNYCLKACRKQQARVRRVCSQS